MFATRKVLFLLVSIDFYSATTSFQLCQSYCSEKAVRIICLLWHIASKNSIAITAQRKCNQESQGSQEYFADVPSLGNVSPLPLPIRKLQSMVNCLIVLTLAVMVLYYAQCKFSMLTVTQYCLWRCEQLCLAFLYAVFLISHSYYSSFTLQCNCSVMIS